MMMFIPGNGNSQQHASSVQNRIDFTGRWSLDVRRSTNLSEAFSDAGSFTMDVSQSADSMVIRSEHVEAAGKATHRPVTVYRFDGSEFYQNDTLGGVQRWIKADWATTGQKLIVHNHATVRSPHAIAERHYTETSVWQFGNNEELLIILTQNFEDGSVRIERRYFHRVP